MWCFGRRKKSIEEMHEAVQPLRVLGEDEALVLRAEKDIDSSDFPTIEGNGEREKGKEEKQKNPTLSRKAGEEWLFEGTPSSLTHPSSMLTSLPGPATYLPHADVAVVRLAKALVVLPHTAVHLRAKRNFTDRQGVARTAGEEWDMTSAGPYLPGVHEDVLRVVEGVALSPVRALHLRARVTFTDVYGRERQAGEEWLVTEKDAPMHLPHVYEEVVRPVPVRHRSVTPSHSLTHLFHILIHTHTHTRAQCRRWCWQRMSTVWW